MVTLVIDLIYLLRVDEWGYILLRVGGHVKSWYSCEWIGNPGLKAQGQADMNMFEHEHI